MPLPTTVSESTRRLNPHLFSKPNLAPGQGILPRNLAPENGAKRIRQLPGTGLNKTETLFHEYLQRTHHPGLWKIWPHGIRLLLANGVTYTPDFFVTGPDLLAFEVKGRHAWDDAIVKLKVAASTHQWLTFTLASYDQGRWKLQQIIP